MGYLSDTGNQLTGIDNPHYVSTKDSGLLFIGADSAYIDGMITLYFASNIKNIEITAKPYYYISTTFNEEELYLDHEVAISVNNGGYIKLNEQVNEETKEVASTVLNLKTMNTPLNTIQVKVVQAQFTMLITALTSIEC